MNKMRELDATPSPLGYSGMQPDDPRRARILQGPNAAKVRSPDEVKIQHTRIRVYASSLVSG